MKWFKHSSQLSGTNIVESIERYYGLPGYARFLKIKEIIAQQMDSTDRCGTTMSWRQIEILLAGKKKQLSEFLTFLEKLKVVRLTANDEQVTIELPELLQLRDNHTKNLQAANKPACKSEPKNTAKPPVLFVTLEQWQHWLSNELCFTHRQVNIPEHNKIMRQWLASNVTANEIEEAVDAAVLEGADIKQLANLHRLVAQNRKQRIEEARR